MIKEITINIDENNNSVISCCGKTLIVSITEKVINSKDFFNLLDYEINDTFVCPNQEFEIESHQELDSKKKEAYRLMNYCIKLVKSAINEINIKSEELREELKNDNHDCVSEQ